MRHATIASEGFWRNLNEIPSWGAAIPAIFSAVLAVAPRSSAKRTGGFDQCEPHLRQAWGDHRRRVAREGFIVVSGIGIVGQEKPGDLQQS